MIKVTIATRCSASLATRYLIASPAVYFSSRSFRRVPSTNATEPQFRSTPNRIVNGTYTLSTDAQFEQLNSTNLLSESEVNWWTSLIRRLATLGIVLCLTLTIPLPAYAGRTGGRMGGSNFNRPSMSTSPWSTSGSFRTGMSGSSGFHSARPTGSFRSSSFFFPAYGVGYGMGGSSVFTIVFYAFMAYILFTAVQRWREDNDYYSDDEESASERSSVCKVQVGLLGLARGLQTDLDSIARRVSGSSAKELHYVLQETLLALNRNPDYCIYGAAVVKQARNIERAEVGFNAMSMKERGKIKEETLSNWDGRRSETKGTIAKQDMSNELIVVTILVATVGKMSLPTIRSKEDLNAALSKLGSVRSSDVLAVEVLWTPQDENDTYSPDELMSEYPELVAF